MQSMKTWTETCGWARAAAGCSNLIAIEDNSFATAAIPTILKALDPTISDLANPTPDRERRDDGVAARRDRSELGAASRAESE